MVQLREPRSSRRQLAPSPPAEFIVPGHGIDAKLALDTNVPWLGGVPPIDIFQLPIAVSNLLPSAPGNIHWAPAGR